LEAKAGTGSESCVVAREDFADEEDFVKAGGSELVFVQMQQRKSMEMQSKLADKVFGSKLCLFFSDCC
jgi:lycopene epsilon-cyclase